MKDILRILYKDDFEVVYNDIVELIVKYKGKQSYKALNNHDAMIITYGDSIKSEKMNPLKTLHSFLKEYVKDNVSAVHLLPMFPFTSDDGFSVVDYLKINEELGDWNDISVLSRDYDLMFDAVINHISKSSDWFKEYKNGNPEFKDFFIECDTTKDYSQVVRPRSLPLYYKYETKEGIKNLWATFSEDQLDINYENPKVLVKVLEVLLEYAKNGARFIRFDAVGFLWKKDDSTCIHLEETHLIVKLMREVLDKTYPNTIVITETNVPHKENISYFGNGYDEAHMVYQFPLPPLTLFSFLSEDATKLTNWAKSLDETPLSEKTSYFNFLASHDGIGMRPTEGILTNEEKQMMVENTIKNKGRIGYKNNPDGSKSPYELNINYLDALCTDDLSIDEKVQKFMAAQSILLSLQGVPGIYIHSLLGSRNDITGMEHSNINRRINREKLDFEFLKQELDEPTSLRHKVFYNYLSLLDIRNKHTAFSPSSKQEVITFYEKVFGLIRESEDETILYVVNVSDDSITLHTEYKGLDLITNQEIDEVIEMKKHEFKWIKVR